MLLTGRGWLPIEAIRIGDVVWSRSEHDETGTGAWKEVEDVSVRPAPVKNLHVGGRLIRVTAEHPFWVRGAGWLPAGALAAGDMLAGKDGEWTPVEAVTDAGEITTVHNLRVAEYHTYFVGGEDWSFSVWSHNADCATQRHHSDPLFMGGDPNQELTLLRRGDHLQLHRDLNGFLRGIEDAMGNHMRPQRGNSGYNIRETFTPQQRLDALAQFYRMYQRTYPDAARDFFRQHPGLR
jgi:Pretoxin HINT domain